MEIKKQLVPELEPFFHYKDNANIKLANKTLINFNPENWMGPRRIIEFDEHGRKVYSAIRNNNAEDTSITTVDYEDNRVILRKNIHMSDIDRSLKGIPLKMPLFETTITTYNDIDDSIESVMRTDVFGKSSLMKWDYGELKENRIIIHNYDKYVINAEDNLYSDIVLTLNDDGYIIKVIPFGTNALGLEFPYITLEYVKDAFIDDDMVITLNKVTRLHTDETRDVIDCGVYWLHKSSNDDYVVDHYIKAQIEHKPEHVVDDILHMEPLSFDEVTMILQKGESEKFEAKYKESIRVNTNGNSIIKQFIPYKDVLYKLRHVITADKHGNIIKNTTYHVDGGFSEYSTETILRDTRPTLMRL